MHFPDVSSAVLKIVYFMMESIDSLTFLVAKDLPQTGQMGPVTMICSPSTGSFCSNEVTVVVVTVGSASLGGGTLLAAGA